MNKFLLIKCISLGAFTFPTPFLIFLYAFDVGAHELIMRIWIVLFLLLSGGIVGVVAYYRDPNLDPLKEWFPSGPEDHKNDRR